jgi:hypothetical protein
MHLCKDLRGLGFQAIHERVYDHTHDIADDLLLVVIDDDGNPIAVGLGQQMALQSPNFVEVLQIAFGASLVDLLATPSKTIF